MMKQVLILGWAGIGSSACTLGEEGPVRDGQPQLAITELVADNSRGLIDDQGSHSDWIEITNRGSLAIDLVNFGLSDDENDPFKWTFPYHVLEPGDRLVVFASNDNRSQADEPLHTNFRLGSRGETIRLTSPASRLLDEAPEMEMFPNISIGRPEENTAISDADASRGSPQWVYFFEPTPGEENHTRGWKNIESPKPQSLSIHEVAVSPTRGFLDSDHEATDWIEITNSGLESVDLEGFGLTDDLYQPFHWVFPETVLQPGDHLVVFASGKDRTGDELHTNFKLHHGERLALYDRLGVLVDSVSTVEAPKHGSLGRSEALWRPFLVPTPGRENDTAPQEPTQIPSANARIHINEFMAHDTGNRIGVDWVELYNSTDDSIDIRGYGLSDSPEQPFKWTAPSTVIEAKGLLLVRLTGEECGPPKCEKLEAGFRLDSMGEELILTAPGGQTEDYVTTGLLGPGISQGRTQTDPQLVFFDRPSPGRHNTQQALAGYAPRPVLELDHSTPDSITVTLANPGSGVTVRMTQDGSLPTLKSAPFPDEPLVFTEPGVVRVRAWREGYIPSPEVSRTLLPGIQHSFPIVAIAIDPLKMFDPVRGLYSTGPNASPESPHRGANYWSRRELPMHMEVMSPEGVLAYETGAGLQIFGGYSRAMPKKSFRLEARSAYGHSAFTYPFFDDQPENGIDGLVLRSGGQDSTDAMFRDVLATWLVRDLSLDVRRYAPCILYINGKYWGIYQFRELINDQSIAERHNRERSEIALGNGEGSLAAREFVDIRRYLSKHRSTDPEAMAWIESQVDLDSFTDWVLSQIFIDNHDATNCRYWKASNPDTQWRWVFYDLDLSMNQASTNSLQRLLAPDSLRFSKDIRLLYAWLLRNPDYKQRFLERASFLYQEVFSPPMANKGIDLFVDLYEPEIAQELERWKHRRDWTRSVEILRRFFDTRPEYLRTFFRDHYRLSHSELDRLFPPSEDL